MNNKISIIVPVFDIAEYLPRCLDSILAQTYQNIEIVAVDDGSSDNSGRILDSYALYDNRVLVIHKENEGVSAARIDGIVAASGDWIGFVDGDDEIEPELYERLLSNAILNNADISHCGYQTIVNDGERIHFFYNTGKLVIQDNETGVRDLLEGAYVEPGLWNKLYKKSLILDLLSRKLIDINIRYNEDYLMNYFLFKQANKSVFEDFCGYHYYSRPTSATRSGFDAKQYLDVFEVSRIILFDVNLQFRDIACGKYLRACCSGYLNLFDKKLYSEEAGVMRRELVDNKKNWPLLGTKDFIKLIGVLYMPHIYRLIDLCYHKYRKKIIYE